MFNLNFTVMKRLPFILTVSMMMLAAVSVTSCSDDDDNTDSMVGITQQDDEATAYLDDVQAEVDDLTMVDDSKSGVEYATLDDQGQGTRTRKTAWEDGWRVDTITYVDFVNGSARFEKVKNGQLVIRVLGGPAQETFEREVTFVNFSINGNRIEGQKRIVKTSAYTYTVTFQNGKITFTDGSTYTRTFERTRTWADGYATPYYVWDDVYTAEGSATGVNRNGKTYTHQITNMIVNKMSCRWIVEGTIEMTVDGDVATFDYGDGECDNYATVTHNGQSSQVRLRGGF